ncbi:MAG: RHS repeat-associated core domain-containing protein [Verrucomicrobia bacterium]|nr:RHS repeat-associated core domain-containing protein [Verrucomicrobiota bacterium]
MNSNSLFRISTTLVAAFEYRYLENSTSLLEKVLGPAHDVINQWEPTRDVLSWKDNRDTLGATLAKTGYTVNAISQRSAMTETGQKVIGPVSRAWAYNNRGELVSEGTPSATHDRGYKYDGIGNRVITSQGLTDPTVATGGSLGSYFASSGGASGANPLNQYGQVTLPGAAPVTVLHDADGNLESGPLPAAPGEASELVWDAENRLIEVQVGTSGPTTYHYDPNGRRIAKTVGTATTLYVFDGWNPVAEYANSSAEPGAFALQRTYTWGLDLSGSLQGAGGVGGLLAIHEQPGNGSAKEGEIIYPAFDGNGNLIRLFDNDSATVASYAYDGFGIQLNPTAADADTSGYAYEQPYGFSTKPRDADTGLYYYGYRWYDPLTGRWPSRDPLGEDGGLNLYGFVGNDGVDSVDLIGSIPLNHPAYPIVRDALLASFKKYLEHLIKGGLKTEFGGLICAHCDAVTKQWQFRTTAPVSTVLLQIEEMHEQNKQFDTPSTTQFHLLILDNFIKKGKAEGCKETEVRVGVYHSHPSGLAASGTSEGGDEKRVGTGDMAVARQNNTFVATAWGNGWYGKKGEVQLPSKLNIDINLPGQTRGGNHEAIDITPGHANKSFEIKEGKAIPARSQPCPCNPSTKPNADNIEALKAEILSTMK